MTKIIAFYLPQFHPVSDNDNWWGPGFTEWVNVARARPLFRGHVQPNIPADLGFYDLRLSETQEQQSKLALEHGVDGFCYWHYWFGNGKQLLEKPMEAMLKNTAIKVPFCLAWANHSWERKQWDAKGTSELLVEQLYPGKKDYVEHFYKMLAAFKDERYITVNEKLLFYIYNPLGSSEIKVFIETWQQLALDNGFKGFHFVGRDADSRNKKEILDLGIDAIYNDDVFNIHHHKSKFKKAYYLFKREVFKMPTVFSYKKAIQYMVTDKCKEVDVIPVIAPNWDHSPRSGGRAIILDGAKPKYFGEVIARALKVVENKPNEEKIIMLKSWNEWGEGNYMEPDLHFGKQNLEMLKKCVSKK